MDRLIATVEAHPFACIMIYLFTAYIIEIIKLLITDIIQYIRRHPFVMQKNLQVKPEPTVKKEDVSEPEPATTDPKFSKPNDKDYH